MTASRNSATRRSALSAALALALALSGAAHAQVGPPVKLGPPDSADNADHTLVPPDGAVVKPEPPAPDQAPATQPPSDQPPADQASTDQPAAAPSNRPHAPEGIAADSLAPPDPDAVGALSAADHPFGLDLWRGTTKETVLGLIPKIGTTSSPALSNLALRLLASAATPPSGDAPKGAMIALRAERLTNALGRADLAYQLLGTIPPSDQSEIIAQISSDLAFLSGNTAAACAAINGHDPSWQANYWTLGTITCEVLNDKADDARLGLDLMREAKIKDDGFGAVVDTALGDGAKLPDTLPSPQPMTLTLLGKTQSPLPKRTIDTANLAVIRAIALGTGFPADQRLDALEKAVAYGAVPAKALADAYLATPLDGDDRQTPINRAQAVGGSRGRAILFNAAHDAISPVAKANFLVTLLRKPPKPELYLALVRASETLLLELPVTQELSEDAPVLARALYAIDQPQEASKWLSIADPAQAKLLVPLARIVDPSAAQFFDNVEMADLLKGDGKDAAGAARRAALANQLTIGLTAPLGDVTPGPNAAIDSEAAAGDLGGTVLAVLAALGDQGAAAAPPLLSQAIHALRRVELDDDARHLAIDAAIAAGL